MTAPTTSDGGGTATGTTVDPLRQLAFKIDIQGVTIGRFAECSGLAASYDVEEYAEGGNNAFVHHLRGRLRYPNVVLRRGITHEDALLKWFYKTQKAEQRPQVTISLLDNRGTTVRHFSLEAALPVRWTGPSATAGSVEAASESLEIAHRGLS